MNPYGLTITLACPTVGGGGKQLSLIKANTRVDTDTSAQIGAA
jgi:hypothetical protein